MTQDYKSIRRDGMNYILLETIADISIPFGIEALKKHARWSQGHYYWEREFKKTLRGINVDIHLVSKTGSPAGNYVYIRGMIGNKSLYFTGGRNSMGGGYSGQLGLEYQQDDLIILCSNSLMRCLVEAYCQGEVPVPKPPNPRWKKLKRRRRKNRLPERWRQAHLQANINNDEP